MIRELFAILWAVIRVYSRIAWHAAGGTPQAAPRVVRRRRQA